MTSQDPPAQSDTSHPSNSVSVVPDVVATTTTIPPVPDVHESPASPNANHTDDKTALVVHTEPEYGNMSRMVLVPGLGRYIKQRRADKDPFKEEFGVSIYTHCVAFQVVLFKYMYYVTSSIVG